MKITLVRHTEVDEAYHGCYNGHIDIGLSNKGELQAVKLAEHFDSQTFDAVFCSDLQRARKTISYFKNAKDVVYTEKLREKSWGRHEGLSYDQIVSQDHIVYNDFIQWVNDLGGESCEYYMERIKVFFLGYLPSLDKENILVVTHAGVIRVLMSIVNKISLEKAFSTPLPYSSYVVYETEANKFSEIKYLE